MCGIAGFFGEGDEADLQSMNRRLVHRGPDGEGYFIDNDRRIYLAHRRLSIVDIEGGHQPMWNEAGSVGVVFNGEIYNHAELRAELVSKGHLFRTDHSDTEVLVHGYEEWQKELPARLNGMFSFAIYDKARWRLFMAKDRFGKKPLYYHCRRGLLVFASELKALLMHSSIDPSVDRFSLQKYFAYGFLPAPNSLYKDVTKLPGGYHLTYDCLGEELKLERYWKFQIEPFESIPKDAQAAWGEELRSLLAQSVKRRLMSDVPLGLFLSGGIDSSAILYFMRDFLPPEQIKTFSIGFHEPSFDESGYARRVANTFGSDHHEEILSLEKAKSAIPEVLSNLDEPLADPSILPTYLLSRFTRTEVTVALGGDGGDELFAGYDPFRALGIARMYRALVPRHLNRFIEYFTHLLPISSDNMSLDFRIRRGLRGLSHRPALWNPSWLGTLHAGDITELFDDPEAIQPENLYSEAISAWRNSGTDNLVDKSLEFYTRFYLQDDILMKIDRASMLNSLEARAPFLDNDLVEFVRRIPYSFKLRHGKTKYVLKQSLKGLLQPEVLSRKKKGFGIPLMKWLKEWRPSDLPVEIPFLNPDSIERRWSEHRHGKADHREFLWCILTLQYHVKEIKRLVAEKQDHDRQLASSAIDLRVSRQLL